MNRKQRQHLRDNPLDWTPKLRNEALDYIEQLEAKLDRWQTCANIATEAMTGRKWQEDTEPGQLASISNNCKECIPPRIGSVTRCEIIGRTGRVFHRLFLEGVELLLQDGARTLKVVIHEEDKNVVAKFIALAESADGSWDGVDAMEFVDELRGKTSTPEPPPTTSEESQPVTPTVIDHLRKRGTDDAHWLANLIEERRQFGIQKYGQELHTHNGRDAIEDARQELGDLVVYLAQAVLEDRYEEAIQFQTRLSRLIPFI